MIDEDVSLRDFLISLSSLDKDNGRPTIEDVKHTIDFSNIPVDNLDQVKELLTVLEDKEMLKIFLVFCIKGFSWYRELNKYFNISGTKKEWTNQKISNCLDKLAGLGFIINVHYTHIDNDIVQEYISKSMSDNFSKWLNPSGKIYIVTKEGLFWGNHIKEYIKNIIFSNRSFFNSYKAIVRVTHAYVDFTEKIQEIENNKLTRKIKNPFDDTYITKKTQLAKEMERNRKGFRS